MHVSKLIWGIALTVLASITPSLGMQTAVSSLDYTFYADQYIPTTRVTQVNITNVGAGYTSNPSVVIAGGGGSGATATAVETSGVLTAVTVTNQGYGYTSAPTVTFTGGGGSGATATAALGDICAGATAAFASVPSAMACSVKVMLPPQPNTSMPVACSNTIVIPSYACPFSPTTVGKATLEGNGTSSGTAWTPPANTVYTVVMIH